MIYRIFGGLFLLLYGLVGVGVPIPSSGIVLGVLALVAGIALLAGF